LAALRVAAASAAEPAFVAESLMYDSAKGQTTVTSQASGFPSLQRTIVSPKSCRLPSIIIINIIITKDINVAQVRKGHKCAMSAEMAVWLRNCLSLYITNYQDS